MYLSAKVNFSKGKTSVRAKTQLEKVNVVLEVHLETFL